MQHLISHKFLSDAMARLDNIKALPYMSSKRIDLAIAHDRVFTDAATSNGDYQRLRAAFSWALFNRESITVGGKLSVRGVDRPFHTVHRFVTVNAKLCVTGHINLWQDEIELSDVITTPFRVIV